MIRRWSFYTGINSILVYNCY